jgi:predicted nucleotidyltransferase component of viral defense system
VKAYLQKLCGAAESPLLAQHLVREYLQARILQSLQRAGAMQAIAFHGGTALHFLYDIPRYSEDLDFALERLPAAYDFRSYLRQIERDFSAEAYTLDFKVNDKQVVHKAFVRFRGLLYELGLSGHETEVIAVKLEIDTNPPDGAVLSTTSLKRHVALNLQHHDRASLLAGKLHAVLQRVYPKGRDIYDLWWYLSQSDWPEPNLTQLNHALAQSGWTGPVLSSGNWRDFVRKRVEQLDWQEDVSRDIWTFIITSDWEEHLNKDSLISLLAP